MFPSRYLPNSRQVNTSSVWKPSLCTLLVRTVVPNSTSLAAKSRSLVEEAVRLALSSLSLVSTLDMSVLVSKLVCALTELQRYRNLVSLSTSTTPSPRTTPSLVPYVLFCRFKDRQILTQSFSGRLAAISTFKCFANALILNSLLFTLCLYLTSC